MIDAIKEIVLIIKDMPAYAVWILAGFLFYKLTVVGSVYGVIRLGINRLFDYLSRDKKIVEEFKIESEFYTREEFYNFKQLLNEMKGIGLKYIHDSDVKRLREALAQYKQQQDIAKYKQKII